MKDDEKSLLAEAESCEDCLCWLAHCQAECCTGVRFRLAPDSDVERTADEVRIRVRMTADLQRYFELHGARVEADAVIFPVSNCVFLQGSLQVNVRCSALQENHLCRLHPHGKPQACRDLTLETARDRDYWIPPRCLYAYKLRAATSDTETAES